MHTACDKLGGVNRFTEQMLLNSYYNKESFVKISHPIKNPIKTRSSADIFGVIQWTEKEIYDFFGIYFTGNHDFRRLLNDYGYKGYPLRKEQTVIGYYELWYSVIHENIIKIEEVILRSSSI